MASVLMMNVGTSDIKTNDGKKICGDDCQAYIQLSEEGNDLTNEIQLPIIKPMLDRIFAAKGALPVALILFVTDQPPDVKPEFRKKDTYKAGKLLQQLLGDRILVELETIADGPNDYVSMYHWFRKRIPQILSRVAESKDTIDHIFIGISGGTPACIFNLSLTLMETSCHPLTALYVSEDSGEVNPGNFAGILRHTQVINLLHSLLCRNDYPAVAELVKEAWPNQKGLHSLLEAIIEIDAFKFENTSKILMKNWPSGYYEQYAEIAQMINSSSRGIQILASDTNELMYNSEVKIIISEMWYQACQKYHLGEYVDFIVRFCGLRETLICKRAQAQGHQVKNKEKQLEDAYEYICKKEPSSDFTSWAINGNSIVTLRNRLWVNHGLEGASQAIINKKWNGNNIINDTTDMLLGVYGINDICPSYKAKMLMNNIINHNIEKIAISAQRFN